MSTLSQLFGGNRFLTDPTQMPIYSATSATLNTSINDFASTVAGFFTGNNDSVDRYGVQDDTNWTANTYKTILSLTATKAGYVSTLIGPTHATAGDTLIWRLTVDGGAPAYVLTAGTAQANTSRIVIGNVMDNRSYTTAGRFLLLNSVGAPSDGITADISAQPTWIGVHLAFWTGSPLLRFNSSLLVEAKASQNITATANVERRSAVVYQRTA